VAGFWQVCPLLTHGNSDTDGGAFLGEGAFFEEIVKTTRSNRPFHSGPIYLQLLFLFYFFWFKCGDEILNFTIFSVFFIFRGKKTRTPLHLALRFERPRAVASAVDPYKSTQ
jgi:hypothetical protein